MDNNFIKLSRECDGVLIPSGEAVKLKKGTPDGIKTWLNITGITITCSGIISNNDSPMNEITKTGLLILFTNYIFDRILTII